MCLHFPARFLFKQFSFLYILNIFFRKFFPVPTTFDTTTAGYSLTTFVINMVWWAH